MEFVVFLIIAACVFVLGVIAAITRLKKKKGDTSSSPLNIFGGTVFATSTVLFMPIYARVFSGDSLQWIKTVLLSIHNTIRLFVVDGDFEIIQQNTTDLSDLARTLYSIFFAMMFLLAPALTFGAVVSMFKNIFSYQRYRFGYSKDAYVFSELNDRSIALASSIRQNHSNAVIVFNDVFDDNGEESYELINRASSINAIMFKKDITAIKFDRHSPKANINFIIVGNNDAECIDQALYVINKYNHRDNTHLYLFTDSLESEYILSSIELDKIKMRRLNDIQSIVYRDLFTNGKDIFDSARQNGDIKHISASVIGMGKQGTEMARALVWFCQMDGYFLTMNCIDKDELAIARFKALCPDFFNENYNRFEKTDQDARYLVGTHAGIDVAGVDFDKLVHQLSGTTYIYVALGDDDLNTKIAIKLRGLFERMGEHPYIKAVVYDHNKVSVLTKNNKYRGYELDIHFVGDNIELHSEEAAFASDMEAIALARHKKWGDEADFWRYEYNYRSSVASVIHHKMKEELGIDGVNLPPEQRSEKCRDAFRKLEHKRWNAYMRSEGYTYGEVRSDLAKMHPCLVNFDDLSEKDKAKDDD